MIQYIIGIIHAIDILCNVILIITIIGFLSYNAVLWTYRKYFITIMIIGLLGVIFIPDLDTLNILFGLK